MIHDCVDAMIAKTLTGTIVSWNSAAERIFGYTAQETLGHSVLIIVPPELVGEASAILERVSKGQCIQDLRTQRVHKNGQRITVSITISPLRDRSGEVIGASTIVREPLTAAQAQPELVRLAYQDPLTSLSNRTHLLDRLEQTMRRNERTGHYGAVFFIDLDNFKRVNDSAGHAAGDRVLIKCARRMQAALREYDTIARWGGDEFVIIVEDLDSDFQTSLQRAQNIAANLLQALRKPYTYRGRTFVCHPSIGVACFRGVMQPVQQVIDDADHAMYQAKLAGKNRVHINCNPPDDTLDAKRSENVAA
jgi:diguanylate cyclase (GGDEF)-like protein/PAS domain S-box-containing protein